MSISIATWFGGFRMALRSRAGCALYGITNIVSPCGIGDSTLGVRSFVQKLHAPNLHDHSSHSQLLHDHHLRNYFIRDHQCSPPPQQLHLSTQDVATILRFLHLDVVKRKVRAVPDACISYKRLLELYTVNFSPKSSEDEGRDIIKCLEQSGDILRVGDTVYLHPHQVARAVEGVLPLPLLLDECGEQELRKMEKEKIEIDLECERGVRKEVWCGLGFLGVQTAGLLRLTFWELSWEVMEPICFYLNSIYFIFGYAFFMRTLRDPTYESFFAARFKIKQSKLMKIKKFNVQRYKELQGICMPRKNINADFSYSLP